jgi:hypothetical protein
MQVQPDYTRQLTDIARVLSKPVTPTWVIAIVSSAIGSAFTLVVQRLAKHMDAVDSREKMRRVVYSDLTHLFVVVQSFMGLKDPVEPGAYRLIHAQLSAKLEFPGQKYLEDHLDVHISELGAVRHLYREFHHIAEEPNQLAVNCHNAQWMMGLYLNKGELQAKYFKKYSQPGQGERLVKLAGDVYRESMERERARQEENRKYLSD